MTEISTRKSNQINDFNYAIEREMTELGSNLWGYFNAVTYYTTHLRGKESQNYYKNNSYGNVLGSNANFNKKAIVLINRVLKKVGSIDLLKNEPVQNTQYQLNSSLTFGKYKNKTLKEVACIDPMYIDWCLINLNYFTFSEDVLSQIINACPNFRISNKAKSTTKKSAILS